MAKRRKRHHYNGYSHRWTKRDKHNMLKGAGLFLVATQLGLVGQLRSAIARMVG